MSSFWEKVLGPQSTQQQQQARPPAPTDNVPWWQRTAVEIPQQDTIPDPGHAQAPWANQITPQAQTPTAPEETLAKTQWAKQPGGNCPNPTCGSSNYYAHPDNPNARPRCYDCGYPISQSGTGVSLKGKNLGPVKEARQIEAASTNNFNPHQIFDRLG